MRSMPGKILKIPKNLLKPKLMQNNPNSSRLCKSKRSKNKNKYFFFLASLKTFSQSPLHELLKLLEAKQMNHEPPNLLS